MGPPMPLNFFMTRLLFVQEQQKVDSVAAQAKDGKVKVEIVPDNPKILKDQYAKSLPPIPFPPTAPPSPHEVEGWKGARIGGWLGLGGDKAKEAIEPPKVEPPTDDVAAMSVKEESRPKIVPVERPKALFPENSARFGRGAGLKATNSGNSGGSRRKIDRPSMKKKNSKTSRSDKSIDGGSGSGSD